MSTPPAGGVPAEQSAAPPTPHCYRHPDRETYVSCTRCGRYICPECMRPAPVGFQCPEEVADARRTTRAPRTVLGGRAAPGRPGLVTQVLIGLCVLGYVLQGLPGVGLRPSVNDFTFRFWLYGPGLADGEYYRLVTAAFLHGGLFHILLNMYALYLLGYQLEQVLGRLRYLALFLVSAVGGNTLSYLVHGPATQSLGASTAIFGFFAAFYVIARKLRLDTSQIVLIVGLNLVITFLIPSIDKYGHLGGLAAGALVGAIFAYVPPRRATVQWALVALVLAGLVAADLARTATLT